MKSAVCDKFIAGVNRMGEVLPAPFLLLLVLIVILAANAGPAAASTGVCGHITSDTTWNDAGSVYVLNCTVTVDPG
jgi:p-aminobenzoyl-glutamate transporter AbgT